MYIGGNAGRISNADEMLCMFIEIFDYNRIQERLTFVNYMILYYYLSNVVFIFCSPSSNDASY